MNAAEYRRRQDRALVALIRRLRLWFVLHGAPVDDAQIREMAAGMLRPVETARRGTYAAAVAYLASLGVHNPPNLKDYGGVDALSKAIGAALEDFTVAGDPIADGNKRDPLVVKKARNRVERAVTRHAQEPARETVQQVADDTPGAAWARMLTGPTSCGFCAMLASRGPIYSSEYIATHRGGASAKAYHDGCDCVAVLVLSKDWEGARAHENLENLWEQTGRKHSGKAARNAFRRSWDRRVRRGETGDYIADTMKE